MTLATGVAWVDQLRELAQRLADQADGDVKGRLQGNLRSLTIVRNEMMDHMEVRVAHEKRLKEIEGRLKYYEEKLNPDG